MNRLVTATSTAQSRRRAITFFALVAALILGLLCAVLIGQVAVTPTEVGGTLLRMVGWQNEWAPSDPIVESTLTVVRFPRALMAILVGAALALTGAIMQAVFGNPLAEPGVVGISSGAATGAALGIVLGGAFASSMGTAALAFVGALVATVFVYSVARSNGRTEVVTLLLTGIAVNAFAGAGLAALLFVGGTQAREQIVFWQLGSLNGSRWHEVGVVAALAAVAIGVGIFLARRYDLLALGERSAGHLGLQVEKLRIISIFLVAIATGAAVAFAGIISFVGLVVPHTMRMLLGPQHKYLLIASVLGGGVLMVFADTLARSLVFGADLPIGLITSLIGGPFFFFLLRRTRQKAGGWG